MSRKGIAAGMAVDNLDSKEPTPTMAIVNEHLLRATSHLEASTRKIERHLATAPELKTQGGV